MRPEVGLIIQTVGDRRRRDSGGTLGGTDGVVQPTTEERTITRHKQTGTTKRGNGD
jgi:hypothetical protein